MTNQEIFDMLADMEQQLFYARCLSNNNPQIVQVHQSVKNALEEFTRATGCHN